MIIVIQKVKCSCVALDHIEHLLRIEAAWKPVHDVDDLAELRQSLLVGGVAFYDVLLQDACCPAPEFNASLRFHAISNGDYHIEAIECNWLI